MVSAVFASGNWRIKGKYQVLRRLAGNSEAGRKMPEYGSLQAEDIYIKFK